MDEIRKELSAGVIVYYDEFMNDRTVRLYLLLNYRHGYWNFAKGKLEGNETNLEAAIRELHEETGLTAEIFPDFEQPISYMFKDPQGSLVHKTVTYFVGKALIKEVVISSEHLSYQWLPLRAALQELTYVNAQQILSMADHFLDSVQK